MENAIIVSCVCVLGGGGKRKFLLGNPSSLLPLCISCTCCHRARRVKSSGKIGGVERVGEMLSKSSEVKQQNETSQPTGETYM